LGIAGTPVKQLLLSSQYLNGQFAKKKIMVTDKHLIARNEKYIEHFPINKFGKIYANYRLFVAISVT
jgi:hypothetical protein